MIDKRDLKPGNLILRKVMGHMIPSEIMGIDRGFIYFDEGGEEKFRQKVEPEHAQPIPLTEEWLDRLGFKHIQKDWTDDSYYMIDYYLKGSFTLSFDFTYEHKVQLKFIHQLQNLFYALQGEELEIQWEIKSEDQPEKTN